MSLLGFKNNFVCLWTKNHTLPIFENIMVLRERQIKVISVSPETGHMIFARQSIWNVLTSL